LRRTPLTPPELGVVVGQYCWSLEEKKKQQKTKNTNGPKISLNQFFVVAAFCSLAGFWSKIGLPTSVPVFLVTLGFTKRL